MTLHTQLLTMIWMISGGFYLGLALDTFRRFSPYWRKNRFLIYFMEVSFWLTQTFILFYILYRVNAGELRVYVFIACLLGFAMYQAIASNLYKNLLEKLIISIITVYKFVFKVIKVFVITPIWLITRIILIIILFTVRIVTSILFFILKLLLIRPLKWMFKPFKRYVPMKMKKIINKCVQFYSIIGNIYIQSLNYLLFKRR